MPLTTKTVLVCSAVGLIGAALSIALWLVWWPIGLGVLWAMCKAGLEREIGGNFKRGAAELGIVVAVGCVGAAAGPVAFGFASGAVCLAMGVLLANSKAARAA